jgi:hypothetical protein
MYNEMPDQNTGRNVNVALRSAEPEGRKEEKKQTMQNDQEKSHKFQTLCVP